MQKLSIFEIICLIAIPTIVTSPNADAIDMKNVVGVWCFDEVNSDLRLSRQKVV